MNETRDYSGVETLLKAEEAFREANSVRVPTALNGDHFANICISQWGADANDRFRPCGPARDTLPAGCYQFGMDQMGMYIQKMNVLTDTLIPLEDEASNQVLAGIQNFWESEAAFTSRGILFRRGIFLHGPAGSGKTALITQLMQQLIARNGVVLMCGDPGLMAFGLPLLRRIEPKRPLIVIFEDIEEMIQNYGEHRILALLDGELRTDNVVNLASSNYPERLGARIINRPSRFDERIFIGMPNEGARRKYLRWATRNEFLPKDDLTRWVRDSAGFSVAHLKEMVVAVFCLKQPYEEVVTRLRSLAVQPKSQAEFGGGAKGFVSYNHHESKVPNDR